MVHWASGRHIFLIWFIFLQKFIKFRGPLVKDATPRSKTRCKFRSYVRSIYCLQLYLLNLFSINLSSEKFLKNFCLLFSVYSPSKRIFFDVAYVLSLFFKKTLSNIWYHKLLNITLICVINSIFFDFFRNHTVKAVIPHDVSSTSFLFKQNYWQSDHFLKKDIFFKSFESIADILKFSRYLTGKNRKKISIHKVKILYQQNTCLRILIKNGLFLKNTFF